MFPPEGLYGSPLRQIPYPNSLVLTAGHDEFVLRMEHRVRHIIEMPSRIDLLRLRLAHPPNFDRPIVRSGYD
jgi:hypothetical protein